MIGKTTLQGKVDTAGTFGPYLQKFPTNPFVDKNDVVFGVVATEGDDNHGWYFDTVLGKFCPSDTAHIGL